MWNYIKLGVSVNQELITFCEQLTHRCSELHKKTGICEGTTTALQNLCYCLLHFSVIHAFYFLESRPRVNKVLLHCRVTTSSTLCLRWLVHVASLRLQREMQMWRLLFVFSLRMHEFYCRIIGNFSTGKGTGPLGMWVNGSGEDLQSFGVTTLQDEPFTIAVVNTVLIPLWWIILMLLLEDYSGSSDPALNPQNIQVKLIYNWLVLVWFAASTAQ